MSHRHSRSWTSANQQRVDIPIQRVSNNIDSRYIPPYQINSIPTKDTTAQWIYDSATGREKFRIKINIEGFHKNDIHARVEENKLCIYGERIENKSQGTSKKIIEKSYNLPSDADKSNPSITYPSTSMMQVDFPAKYSSRKTSVHARDHSADIESFHENRTDTIPIQRISINSRNSTHTPVVSNDQAYKFHQSIGNSKANKTLPAYKQVIHNIHRRRPTPTVGLQPTYNGDVQRSMRPTLSNIIEEESTKSSSSSSSDTDSTLSNRSTSYFPRDFNSEIFYESVFQPEIFTDDRRQRYIEMRLDVQDYKQDDLKVSINDNDLIVQSKNTNFYKQITLPSNADLSSLSTHYHHDKKLYITVKLLNADSSFRYI
ncbi:hypothetical protein I4U23_002333 [Adineta vaga]|nr:hypothetical protein I4U23_002333 [Adineta vaga]